MIDIRWNDGAAASNFTPDELRGDFARDARTKRFAAMLVAKIVRCYRAVPRGARAPQNFASEIFSDRDELHFVRDDAASRVHELRYGATIARTQRFSARGRA